jgi:hypothetical protein
MSTYILRDNQQYGPYEDADIRSGLASGSFLLTDHAWREGMADWQALSALYPPQPSAPQRAPQQGVPQRGPAPVASGYPAHGCPTCRQGSLVRAKNHRMSTPVVVLGYIFLVPSVIGFILGILGLCYSGTAGSKISSGFEQQARAGLAAEAIPAGMIDEILSNKQVSPIELAALTPKQRSIVEQTKVALPAGKLGIAGASTAIIGGLFIGVIVISAIGELLGWLLIRKKEVLQCQQCGAVVAA